MFHKTSSNGEGTLLHKNSLSWIDNKRFGSKTPSSIGWKVGSIKEKGDSRATDSTYFSPHISTKMQLLTSRWVQKEDLTKLRTFFNLYQQKLKKKKETLTQKLSLRSSLFLSFPIFEKEKYEGLFILMTTFFFSSRTHRWLEEKRSEASVAQKRNFFQKIGCEM